MARIINNKFLFIHVAKTGGTFVREVFNYYGVPNHETGPFEIEDHYSISQVLTAHPELEDLQSFGYVRHPVSWYRSRWAYGVMTKFGKKMMFITEARNHWMASVWSEDLNTFVENTLKEFPNGIATAYFRQMLGILDGGSPGRKVDKVFRTEDLLRSIKTMLIQNRVNFSDTDPIFSTRPKDSKQIDHQIAPSLAEEIKKTERKLIEGYYS